MIKPIEEKKEWDTFFSQHDSPSFLHAWEWGDLQQSLGHEVLRIGMYEGTTLILIAQILKMKTRRGNFLFIPHGPVVGEGTRLKAVLPILTEFLIHTAKNEGFSFIRISPVMKDSEEGTNTFNDVGYKKAPIYMHAERMWVLPIAEKSEDELLMDMRKTTRYSIKKAQKDGVTIKTNSDSEALDEFWKIYQTTAERESFTPFSKKFISEEFTAFHKTGHAVFLSAMHDSPPFEGGGDPKGGAVIHTRCLASALILFTESTAFYHQGASIHSKIPAPYLLQWEAIRLAKARGCKLYNFWGILQPGRTPKSWSGLTLFKQGFGGHQLDYIPTQDYIISPLYYLNYGYELYLNWKRGV